MRPIAADSLMIETQETKTERGNKLQLKKRLNRLR